MDISYNMCFFGFDRIKNMTIYPETLNWKQVQLKNPKYVFLNCKQININTNFDLFINFVIYIDIVLCRIPKPSPRIFIFLKFCIPGFHSHAS